MSEEGYINIWLTLNIFIEGKLSPAEESIVISRGEWNQENFIRGKIFQLNLFPAVMNVSIYFKY